ncbi:SRPBCC family protein [Mycolicibacterium boenickei]
MPISRVHSPGLVSDDVEIVRRVLAHIDAGTTDAGEIWREPVENYLDRARFDEELRLLRSLPSVFGPSAAIVNPGDYVERVCFGVPLFAVRGRDGKPRVFRNACRHRAMALVEGKGCAQALVCRYHGWTYRLDGSLAHVPHADGFPDLNLSTRGLVEVPSWEVDGVVVIGALENAGSDSPRPYTDAAIAGLADGSPWRGMLAPELRCGRTKVTSLALNWKVLVEQFLEGYHIRSTHKDTFYPVQYDNLNVVETFGHNSRITYPYRNIERLRGRPESEWTADTRVTYVYQLFPNCLLGTFPDQLMVAIIEPSAVSRSTLTTYYMPRAGVGGEPDDANASGPEATLLDQGLAEDNEMSAGVQRGLRAGANAFVEFGRHESGIRHFHATLSEGLASIRKATAAESVS